MALRIFGRKKSRKYPVKVDEEGRSARSRCFEMFPEKFRKDLVSKEDLKKMLFVDVGYDSNETVMHWPEAAGPQPGLTSPHK